MHASRHFLTLSVCCLILVSCATQPASEASASAKLEQTNWYVASREPLTFCPKGYTLPEIQYGYLEGEYVYLSDRQTRFFIPRGKDEPRFRKEALVVRESSLSESFKRRRTVDEVVNFVLAVTPLSALGKWYSELGPLPEGY